MLFTDMNRFSCQSRGMYFKHRRQRTDDRAQRSEGGKVTQRVAPVEGASQ